MSPPPPRKRILVVEDDEPIARLLERYLTSAGFDVHSESRGTQALRYAAANKPDLVILDLRLPDVDGMEVCERLRMLYHSWMVPIMMLTGLDSSQDLARGLSSGADAYVTKPFEPAALLPVIENLLSKIDPEAPPPPPDPELEPPPDSA
jgi:DNA-binding response OmpR family regulator